MTASDDAERIAAAIDAIRRFGPDSETFPSIRLYADHHLHELGAEYWLAHTGSPSPSLAQILDIMIADTTWDDIDDDGSTVDCTLPGGVTNYLLSVRFDPRGSVRFIEMES